MYVCMCMYGQQFQQKIDQPGIVTDPARGQLTRIYFFSLRPFASEKLVSPERQVRPSRLAPARPFCTLRLNLVLTREVPPASRDGVNIIYLQPPSGQSRVYRVTQLRTDGVHFRESAGTEPANSPQGISSDGYQFLCASLFPHPLLKYDLRRI